MSNATSTLERFQRQFSAAIRSPLDRTSGTLAATPVQYPAELRAAVCAGVVTADERIATYNRQYWFRLFTVLQNAYPLTTALVGAWAFNIVVERYLLAYPPSGHDLAAIVPSLAAFALDGSAEHASAARVPNDAFVDAITIDAAFYRAFVAPLETALVLAPADAPRLARAKLRWSMAASIVDERRPLIALRRTLPEPLGEHRAPVPAPHDERRAWLVFRPCAPTPRLLAVRSIALEPAHAELLRLLREHSIADALVALERDRGVEGTAAQRWLAEGMQHGLWTHVDA